MATEFHHITTEFFVVLEEMLKRYKVKEVNEFRENFKLFRDVYKSAYAKDKEIMFKTALTFYMENTEICEQFDVSGLHHMVMENFMNLEERESKKQIAAYSSFVEFMETIEYTDVLCIEEFNSNYCKLFKKNK
jgi:hypothetical protein